MSLIEYKGFGGAVLPADVLGDDNDPAVLLIPDIGQPRSVWRAVADGLALSGRRVVNLDLRAPGGIDQLAAHVEDLRLVLAQMGSRPVVVAARRGGWIATRALATDGILLAGGLVLVDMPDDADAVADAIAARLALPIGELADIDDNELALEADRTDALLGQLLEFLERHQPREATEFQAGSDPRTLRDAMGCFATGVTIVTALDAEGTPVGLTANSFTSVSLDPPLLLVCIANSSGTAPALREAEHFGVNVLQIGQQPASNRFATRGEDRFANLPWAPGQTGVPLLGSSLVSFECQRESLHEAGDHFILVGRVVRAQFEPHRDPLLYFRGKYRRLHFA